MGYSGNKLINILGGVFSVDYEREYGNSSQNNHGDGRGYCGRTQDLQNLLQIQLAVYYGTDKQSVDTATMAASVGVNFPE